jgi:hypothetical protein
MNRIKHVVSTATVVLGLALAPAALAAGHAGGGFGGGFGGHFGGFGGHIGGFGGHTTGGFGGEHASVGVTPLLRGHSFDGGNLVAGRGFAGGGHELGGLAGGQELGNDLLNEGHGLDSFAGGEHELGGFAGEDHGLSNLASTGHVAGGTLARGGHYMGDGLVLDGRAVGDSHLMYGRMPRYGRGGVFLGYYYPDPSICYQYPDDYNPAVGCYGLYPDS